MSHTIRYQIARPVFLLAAGLLFVFAALAVHQIARADPGVLYAAPTAQGSGNCSSWENTCTLQTALAGAASGDEIWVLAGVHYPGSMITDTFTLQSGVAVYGGFAGTESTREQRNWAANLTVLSGDIDQNDLTDPTGVVTSTANITGTNSYHVVTGSGTDQTAVLDGFTITAGQANGGFSGDDGGGMYVYAGAPTVANMTFSGNLAHHAGGGMANINCSGLTLTQVTFTGNRSEFDGGGLYSQNCLTMQVTEATFIDNSAVNDGGGMKNDACAPLITRVNFIHNSARFGGGLFNGFNDLGGPTLIDVVFSGNQANEGGGMMQYYQSSPKLTNVIFQGNYATQGGGGMRNWNNSSPILTNVTFAGNLTDTEGSAIYNGDGSSPLLQNVIAWGNASGAPGPAIFNYAGYVVCTPTIRYSLVQGCNPGGAWDSACGSDGGHNLTDTDPLFSAPEPAGSAPTTEGDYRLQNASSAINAGDNAADLDGAGPLTATISDLPTDLDGNPRIVLAVVDLGSYENQAFPCPAGGRVYVDEDAVGARTGASWDDAFTALQDALYVSNDCEIWVAEGVYYPDQDSDYSENRRTATFQLKNGVALYGGFAGSETTRDARDWQTNVTVLSGDIDGNDLTDPYGVITDTAQITGTNSYHVVTDSGSDSSATLDGFFITGGLANHFNLGGDPLDYYGAGMYNKGNALLTNLIFSGNMAAGDGGGLYNTGSPSLEHVTFIHNTAAYGGGIFNHVGNPNLLDVAVTGNHAWTRGGGIYNNSSPTLTGVTFTNNSTNHEGGGMFNHFGNPTLTDINFNGNLADYKGGGMFNEDGNPTLTNITFGGNLADMDGGGMYNANGSPILTNVTFNGNSAGYDGGGMHNSDGSPTLTNVTFSGNSTNRYGGGMLSSNSSPTLTDVTFSDNSADYGGGMRNLFGSSPIITNATFSGNQANHGGGMENYSNSHPTLTNVILWGNSAPDGAGILNDSSTPQISYSDIQGCGGSGSWDSACGVDGGGNIEADPLFVDAANGDLHLQDASPAINAGSNAALPPGLLTDLDGAPRFVRVFVDLGAYENQTFACPAGGVLYVDQDATGAQTGASWADALLTLQDALQVTEACEIWMAEGLYYPDDGGSQAEDDYRATFQLKNGVEIYGGFAGTETSRDQRDWQATPTFLSGDLQQNDVDINGDGLLAYTETVGVTARHVLVAENITSTIRIEGLTIRSGLNAAGDGAGMYLEHSLLHMQDVAVESNHAVNGGGIASIYSSVTLENVSFAGNSAVLGNTGGGGGLYLYGAVPGYWQNLNNVTFVGNRAGYAGGGGLRVQYSPMDVTHSAFISNTAVSDYEVTDPVGGGGMYVSNSTQTYFADTLFRANHAIGRLTGGEDIPERFTGNGGGLYVNQSGYELVRVTFEENSAAVGGGFYVYAHSEGHLSQVTFSHNHAYYLGGGAYSGAIEPYYHEALFTHNRAPYCGALCGWAMISDSVFTYNQAYDPNPSDTNVHGHGGALNGYPNKIINSAFYSNTADASGPDLTAWYAGGELINVTMTGGISCLGSPGSSMTIMNSIIHTMAGDCTVTFRHSIYGELNVTSVTDEGGNLPDVDPLFVDLANGDLRLQSASPAIDSGSSALATYGIDGAPILADLDGNPRLVDMPTVPDTGSGPAPIVDMGAYEAQYVDVALDKAVLPPTAAPGEAITFTLAVSNTGSLLASGIIVTDSLPAWLWGVSVTSTLDITNAGALPPYVWQVQDLARGQGGVITVSGVLTLPLAAGTYTNTAFISATGDLLAANNTATISFSVPNIAPVFASIPLITATEAAPYTYSITTQDDNGDALTITAPTLPDWLTLTDHGDGTATLAGTPETADVGQHSVALNVADSGGLTDTQSFTITIAYINDAPTFTSAPVLTATQDVLYSYAVAAGDSDLIHGDALTITAPTLPAWLALDWTPGAITATLSGTPTNTDVGNHSVVLRTTDSAGLFAEQAFTIAVANVNDAPEFTSAPVLAATQDVLYTYAVAADDPDLIHGDALTVTAPTLPAWLTLTDNGDGTATLSGTPANAEVGEHPVVLRVTDRAGAFAEQSFTITVANVNDAPFFTSTPVLSTTQDVLYSYAIASDDPDLIHGDTFTITAPTLPVWLTLTDHGDGTAALSGTPTNANVGQHSVVLRVTDSAGLRATQTFTITVANVNDAPIFTSTPVLTTTQDAPYSYAVVAGDLDIIHGDALTITALTLPAWLTLDWTPGAISATLSGTPTNAEVGDHAVALRVTDRAGLFAEQVFTITVTNINDAPAFTSTPITTAAQDAPYTYTIAVGDLDLIHGDTLTITATTLPGWLTLEQTDAITATLTGTPTNADVGDHSVLLLVTDSGGLSGTQTFIITVANSNEAPSFSSAPVLTATQDVLYSYAIAAGDPDLIHGDTLTITAPTLPSWLNLTDHGDGTATLSGTPANANVGDHAVTLRVTDSSGLTDTQFFTITVTNVNDAPEFTSAPVLTGTLDVLYTYAVTADDLDLIHGDALTITAPTLPAWLSLVDHGEGTATLSGTPGDNDAGQNLVVLRVTDRVGAFVEQAFVITVAERPRYYIYLPIVLRNWQP